MIGIRHEERWGAGKVLFPELVAGDAGCLLCKTPSRRPPRSLLFSLCM